MSRRKGLTLRWTAAQQAAISARGRTLVAAAAGSGKTGVLTERIVRAIVGDGGDVSPPLCRPEEVLAVTFTRKAAAEMRGRIGDELLAAGRMDLVAQIELATIGTIHSLCAEVLRRHGAAIGVDPGFTMLEESQDAWFASLALDDALLACADDEDVAWLRSRFDAGELANLVFDLRAHAGRTLDGLLRFPSADSIDGNDGAGVSTSVARRSTRAIERIWIQFRRHLDARLADAGALTFEDLELRALEAARIPEVATALRARWQLVSIDEFQDTNARQLALLDEIAGDRLFMVGDEWQSIYRFRGADVDVFRAQHASERSEQVPMRENFRSDGPVLDVVNTLFAHAGMFGDRYEPVICGADSRHAVAGPSTELLVIEPKGHPDLVHLEGHDRREREVRRVAERIGELVHARGVHPGDIAVLYESSYPIDRYEAALRARGVPTLRASSTGFFDHQCVRDVMQVLAALRNPHDDLAVLGMLAGPVGRLTWTELADLADGERIDGDHPTSVLDVARGCGTDPVRAAVERLDSISTLARKASLVEVVSHVVDLPELQLAAAQEADGVQRVANLRRLVELAVEARGVGVLDVARFVDFVEAQRRFRKLGEATIADEDSGAVRLMSIHASKGLEFPHVFLVEGARTSVTGRRRGSAPSPLVDEAGFVHVPAPSDDGPARDTGSLAQLRAGELALEAEERMRKLYVALTRAEHRLYVSATFDAAGDSPGPHGIVDPQASPMAWLFAALDLPHQPPGRTTTVDALLTIDTHATTTTVDRHLRERMGSSHELATALQFDSSPAQRVTVFEQPTAESLRMLRGQLATTVAEASGREWRLADGSRLHDVVARMLDNGAAGMQLDQLLAPGVEPWLGERTRVRLVPVASSPVFESLVAAGGRAEVPFVVRTGAVARSDAASGVEVVADPEDVEAGRFDALARLDDGRWWIVDWKATLPESPAQAWSAHGSQLARYAEAARIGGATGVLLTLVALDDPRRTVTWNGDDVAPDRTRRSSAPAMPVPAAHP